MGQRFSVGERGGDADVGEGTTRVRVGCPRARDSQIRRVQNHVRVSGRVAPQARAVLFLIVGAHKRRIRRPLGVQVREVARLRWNFRLDVWFGERVEEFDHLFLASRYAQAGPVFGEIDERPEAGDVRAADFRRQNAALGQNGQIAAFRCGRHRSVLHESRVCARVQRLETASILK